MNSLSFSLNWKMLPFLLLFIAPSLQAADLSETERTFFETKIRPVLAEACYGCHSAEEKVRGGLVVDSRDGLRHGGDLGPAVVPGDLEASLLWTAINGRDDLEMPPRERLSAQEIEHFRQWILMGAPDPRVAEERSVATEIDVEAGKAFWSFQPPENPKVPSVKQVSWPASDVDRFVLSQLESASLQPSKAADPVTLLRRVSVDLTGLLPEPEEVKAFLAAWKQAGTSAYREKVDELLRSPHFGERWGRHWLDVARYAESTGKERNMTYPHAWRYRDYVIDAFNEDKPFDRFIQEQVAGDLLPVKSDAEWAEHLVATGFLAVGPKGLNERNPRQFALDVADEQIDTTFQAVMGLTVACARCHDHKSDPIPTADYYALSGIFQSTRTHFGTVRAATNRRATPLLELPLPDAEPLERLPARAHRVLRDRLARAREELAEAMQANRELRRRQGRGGNVSEASSNGNPVANLLRLRSSVAFLEARLEGFDDEGSVRSLFMGVQDGPRPVNVPVLVRGELGKPAQTVERGFLQVMPHTKSASSPPRSSSGRLELADWLTDRANPLTARVMVNRLWQHLFGAGLVTSVNDFGATGKAPSHPELLDYLAVRFMDGGWSVKAMIRELVLTKTYRQSATFDPEAFMKDPANALIWRMAPRRMDAETFRDNLLLAAGNLDRKRPRGSVVAEVGDAIVGRRLNEERLNASTEHRSVYLPMVRDALPEALELFDVADPNRVMGTREVTNIPSQALYLLNHSFVLEQGAALARRLGKEGRTPGAQVSRAYEIALGRPAVPREHQAALQYLRHFFQEARAEGHSQPKARQLALQTFSQSLLVSAEFRYLN